MSVKEIVLERINLLPDDIGAAEMESKLQFILGVQKAVGSMERGEGIAKETIKQQLPRWAGR